MKKKMFYGADRAVFENAKILRNNLTAEERILWGRLKQCFPTHKFRRQHPISNYIADFYWHKLKLVIEADGSIHYCEENQKLDEIRQRQLQSLGLKVLRFTNEEIRTRIEVVLEKIKQYIDLSSSYLTH